MILLLAALAGCARDNPEPGLNEPYCEETATVLAADEISPLGLTGAEVVGSISGAVTVPLTWSDGTQARLALDLGDTPTEVRFIDSEEAELTGSGPTLAIGVTCDDRLEVDVPLDFVSDDGAFDEHWDVTLRAATADEASFSLSPEAFSGSFQVEDHVTLPDGWTDLSVRVDGQWSHGIPSGEVSAVIEGQDPGCTGDDCGVWAETQLVASWAYTDTEP